MDEETESRKMANTDLNDSSEFHVMLLEPRPFRPFKTSEEYLYAMKEDLAEWLNSLYGLQLVADNFLEQMETGVILCRHANHVIRKAREYYRNTGEELGGGTVPIPDRDVFYRTDVLPETFHARDNISNFISWCRALAIKECLLFETDDLVLRKNERSFILCLLEVARRGAKFGMPAPLLVQMEQEIDAELANDDGYETVSVIRQQVVTNDLRSLHERVVELLSRCTCPSQFPMIRVADGKYRIGDTKVLIFVRILRSHVMVRVGGGWDTLAHYLDKHDPCRCKSGHRLATSAKLTMHHGRSCIPSMHVTYNRPTQAPSSTPSSPQGVRRASTHSTPLVHRYSNPSMELNSTSPPSPTYGYPPRHPPRSDESSASNSSLPERYDAPPKLINPVLHSEDSSSEFSGNESPPNWTPKKPARKRKPKPEIQKDTLPSSWRYSPGSDAKQNSRCRYPNDLPVSKAPDAAPRPSRESSTRLPSLSPRVSPSHGTPPTGKGPQTPQWSEKRSQSSEDLYKDQFLTPNQQKNLVFHSRGPSPVNMKGQNRCTFGLQPNANKSKDKVTSFKRCDPVRHSYHHAPRPKFVHSNTNSSVNSKHIPQTITPERHVNGKQLTRARPPSVSPDRYSCNGVSNLRKQAKQIQNGPSPVLEKLFRHRELCSDQSFLKKIESLIAEYETQARKQDCTVDCQGPFPKETNDIFESQQIPHYPSRGLKDKVQKSPSKIPLPTWNSKVKT